MPAVRFAKAIHFLSDLEATHELLTGQPCVERTCDPFLHRTRPPREPLPLLWAPLFAIQTTDCVLRYYKEEYQDDKEYHDRRLDYVALQYGARLRTLQGIPATDDVMQQCTVCSSCSGQWRTQHVHLFAVASPLL